MVDADIIVLIVIVCWRAQPPSGSWILRSSRSTSFTAEALPSTLMMDCGGQFGSFGT
jgi:hypothetical protein